MRRLPHLAAASTLTITLAACGSGADADSSADSGEAEAADLTIWFMEDSVPESAQDWLVEEFEDQNEGSTLTVRMQPWAGVVELLQTALPDPSETPDLVEVGNTQAATFTSVGAFSPVDDILDELGGDSLIDSGVEAGSWEGTAYAPPLYAGSRIIFYRQDLLDAADIEVPTTLEELNEAAVELNEANPEDTEDFSGIYLASSDPKTLEGWLFTYGGDYAAEQDDGSWEGTLSSPESLEGLRAAQELMEDGSEYVSDPNEAVPVAYELFNSGRIGFYSGLALKEYDIDEELWESGQAQVMPLPGPDPETPGTTFAGGSNMAISAASENQELSQEVLRMIYSEGFQSMLAEEAGWVPGNLDYADNLTGHSAEAFQEAVEFSELTPNTPDWGVADSAQLPLEIWTRIADGEDVEDVAADVDTELEEILND